ncbi:MAG: Flp pilus assembly complex ATPase component TadA [Planctomycetota bacterium]|nr:MAG: Flp pilus assembly complex ATPase component TadA [Planctomycetota bacterium]
MSDLILASLEYGGYISILKFIVFLVFFFLWLPLLGWVYRDAELVKTKENFWTAVLFIAGASAILIWLFMPIFIIGMLFYIIAVGATSLGYVMHRNARVPAFQRVLTPDHIRSLFVSEEKKLEVLKDFRFITANNNEVPMPEPKTADFFGYKAAYDVFNDAIWRRASDIIFLPAPPNYNVAYYVDGAALKQPPIPKEQMDYFIHFVKQLADLDPNEKRKPQTGKFRTHQSKVNTDWEIITAGSTVGEQVKIKQIIQENIIRLKDINLTSDQYQQLDKIRGIKQGIFIIAGPKKSGVSTTFYALLRNHDAFLNSIATLERSLSADMPNITQNVFGLSDTGTTSYAKKLQVIMRREPDIIGVADCEDGETAQVACQTAKDGKLIYLTLDADNVIKALGKWLKFVGDKNLAADALLGISCQRLLRKLCEECKQAYEPNKELLRKFNIPAEKAKVLYRAGKVIYSKRGKPTTCEHCQGTGFVGRMGVFEMIIVNNQLRNVIKQSASLPDVATQFRRAKMLYLQEQALKKVVAGKTSINEMVRVLSKDRKKRKTGQKT